MKILRITSCLHPYVLGGIGLHAHLLSLEQCKHGHEVTIITCIPENTTIEPLDVPYKIINVGQMFELCGNAFCPKLFFTLYRNRYSYDIIDAHSHLFISTNIAALIRRLGSSPLIITNHGLRSQAVPKTFQEIFLKTIGKFTFNSADTLITFTEREKQDMIDIGADESKIHIIQNGVDTTVFHPVSVESHPFTVLWVGRLSAGKGLKYTILGFKEFIKTIPDALLYIVGDGPYLEPAQRYVQENGLSEHILFTGRIENEEMLSYYSRSSVYLMTSMSEGMPRTLLESMACGIPVICTDIPQLIPIIQEGGFVIPKKDIDAVVSSLMKFVENPDLIREFGTAGRKLIEKSYSLERMNFMTEELYDETIVSENTKGRIISPCSPPPARILFDICPHFTSMGGCGRAAV